MPSPEFSSDMPIREGYAALVAGTIVEEVTEQVDILGFKGFIDIVQRPLATTDLYSKVISPVVNAARYNAELTPGLDHLHKYQRAQAAKSFRYGALVAAHFVETFLDDTTKVVMEGLAFARFPRKTTQEYEAKGQDFLDEAQDRYYEMPAYFDFLDALILRARDEEEESGVRTSSMENDRFAHLDAYFFRVGFGAIMLFAHEAQVNPVARLMRGFEQPDFDEKFDIEFKKLMQDEADE